MKSIRFITYCCLALALLVAGCTTNEQAPGLGTVLGADEPERFESAATVDEVRHQIEKLPKNTSWWTVNGQDMATGVDCSEEYYDTTSCYYRLMETTGEAHWDNESADNPYEYIAGLKVGRYAEQGTSFEYGSINTYILGWLVEKLTGMPFQDAFSREIWTRIGTESDAAFLAPRYGVPMFAGGFLGRLRDVARFGLLFTQSYSVVTDKKIISDQHIETLKNGGRPELLANARWGAPDELAQGIAKHNVYQWDMVYTNNDVYKGGWAGQGLLVNPDRDLVAVYAGYFNEDQSELSVLPRLRQVLNGVFGEVNPAE